MKIKQGTPLQHKAKIAAVVGATICLTIAMTKFGQGGELNTETNSKAILPAVTVASTVQTKKFITCGNFTNDPAGLSQFRRYELNPEERYLLCKIAMAEAGNQDTEGKALMILVVLNRVEDDGFPETIREVIYEPVQFSPVLEGTFEDTEPDEDCWKALEMVEGGWDESQGALYFESKSDSTWHQTHLKFLFQHGNHYFYTAKN